MQRDVLVRVIDSARLRIVERWTAEAHASSPAYADRPIEEIRESVERMIDGIRKASSEGDYSELFDILEYVVPKRVSAGFKLSEIQRIVNIGTGIVLDELKSQCSLDKNDECIEALNKLIHITSWATMSLTDRYEDVREKESVAGTLTALSATQDKMEQEQILKRSLELAIRLSGCTHGAVVMQHLGGCAAFYPESDMLNEALFARLAGRTMRAGRTVVADENDIAQPTAGKFDKSGTDLQFITGMPIKVRGRVIGALVLGSDTDRTLSSHEANFLEAVASQIGLGCENARMMEVLSRKAELVKAQHDELNTMMDELGAMVYVADMETYDILAANRPLMELYGEDAVGRKCYETLQSGRKSPCDFCTNKFLVEEGKPKDAHIRKFRNSLTGRWYQCLDKAIRWTNGRLVRLEIALDVTELESARERLDLMTAQFSLYNSLLVHDISNHASSAKGFIHILRDPDAPEERRGAMAENALVQIGKIETLVDRVSKIVKAEAVGTEEMSETELGTLLDEAIADTQAVSEFANVEFRKEYRASGCRVRLGEFGHDIFLNLLTNAAKYGGGRPVTVKVEESTLDGEPAWRVCVTDQGCGIPDDKKGLMFEQYERLPTLSQIKGLGLGLTIVRTLTHAYGGNVGLEDRVEGDHTKGSVFSVAFPKIGP